MKHLKYTFAIILSLLSLLLPLILLVLGLFAFDGGYALLGKIGLIAGAVLLVVGLLLQRPLQTLRVYTRREIEYDEFGRSKSKGDYERLSKKERDAIDLQKTADMERLVNTTAIKKMTKTGPANPMKELDSMIGLPSVKTAVKEMVARMAFEAQENKKKKKKDRTKTVSGRHMCFTGNAGTGKTTVARIMTSFLYEYGYIKQNKCIEIDGNFLKAGTESALKTELVLRHAYGGVLFIDEAYVLADSSDNSGKQVIATLIKQMEDRRDDFILILAGYTREMKQLIELNSGFESRIKDYLHFPDYDTIEMREIFQQMANKHNFVVDAGAFPSFDFLVARERRSQFFGNGRTARNILDKVIDRHTYNLATGTLSDDKRYILCMEDFQGIKLGRMTE